MLRANEHIKVEALELLRIPVTNPTSTRTFLENSVSAAGPPSHPALPTPGPEGGRVRG